MSDQVLGDRTILMSGGSRGIGLANLSRYSAGGALEYDIFVDRAASD